MEGNELPGDAFLAALNNPDLMPAAGPGAGTVMTGGGGYADALLAGVDGVDRFDKLEFDGWGRGTEVSEIYRGMAAAGGAGAGTVPAEPAGPAGPTDPVKPPESELKISFDPNKLGVDGTFLHEAGLSKQTGSAGNGTGTIEKFYGDKYGTDDDITTSATGTITAKNVTDITVTIAGYGEPIYLPADAGEPITLLGFGTILFLQTESGYKFTLTMTTNQEHFESALKGLEISVSGKGLDDEHLNPLPVTAQIVDDQLLVTSSTKTNFEFDSEYFANNISLRFDGEGVQPGAGASQGNSIVDVDNGIKITAAVVKNPDEAILGKAASTDPENPWVYTKNPSYALDMLQFKDGEPLPDLIVVKDYLGGGYGTADMRTGLGIDFFGREDVVQSYDAYKSSAYSTEKIPDNKGTNHLHEIGYDKASGHSEALVIDLQGKIANQIYLDLRMFYHDQANDDNTGGVREELVIVFLYQGTVVHVTGLTGDGVYGQAGAGEQFSNFNLGNAGGFDTVVIFPRYNGNLTTDQSDFLLHEVRVNFDTTCIKYSANGIFDTTAVGADGLDALAFALVQPELEYFLNHADYDVTVGLNSIVVSDGNGPVFQVLLDASDINNPSWIFHQYGTMPDVFSGKELKFDITATDGDGSEATSSISAVYIGADGTIYGGSDNDVIYSGAGDHDIWGGAGDDIFAWKLDDMGGKDTIKDFRQNSPGEHDMLRFDDLLSGDQTELGKLLNEASWDNNTITAIHNGVSITMALDGANTVVTVNDKGVEQVIILAGYDFIATHAGQDANIVLQDIFKVTG